MAIGKRIRSMRLARGWSQAELAAAAGIDRSSVARYELYDVVPSAEVLAAISRVLEVPVASLLESAHSPTQDQHWEAIPILGRLPAGELVFNQDTVIGYFPTPGEIVAGGIFFYMQIQGDYMERTFREGDYVLIRVQNEVDPGEVGAVVVDDHESLIRRLYPGETSLVLHSDNMRYPPIALPKNRVRIVGQVVGMFRKTYSEE